MNVTKIEVLANPHEFGVVGCVTPPPFVCKKSGAQRAVEVRRALRDDGSGLTVYSVLTDAGKYYVRHSTDMTWWSRDSHAF
jgi:predicted aminopeptidase